jgi:type II secretory pathway pseudopilin PulG
MSLKSGGYTLIETIVYAAILSMVVVLVIGSLLIITRSLSDVRASRDIIITAEIALERISREIRLADSIDQSGSIFGSHPGYLKLNTIDSDTGASTTIEFFLDGSDIKVQKGENMAETLNTGNVSVSRLVFYRINASSTSEAVRTEIEFRTSNSSGEKREEFFNTIILRRSY